MNYLDRPRISVVKGTLADIPPIPSMADIILSMVQQGAAIKDAAEKNRNTSRASNLRQTAKAAAYVPMVRKLLKARRGAWVQVADIVAHIEDKADMTVNAGNLGRAMRDAGGFERREIQHKICWRLANDA